MVVVSIPTLILVLISVSQHLQRSECSYSSEEKNSQQPMARCDVTRCNGLVGLWLRLCLETLCSSSSSSAVVDGAAVDSRQQWMSEAPRRRQLQTNKEFRDYINKERLKEMSPVSPTTNDELDSTRDPDTSDKGNKGSQSSSDARKTFLDACFSFCGRLTVRLPPDAAASCLLQLCPDTYSSDSAAAAAAATAAGPSVGHQSVRKRWGSRVCMDNHCGTVENDIQAYIVCGMSYCA